MFHPLLINFGRVSPGDFTGRSCEGVIMNDKEKAELKERALTLFSTGKFSSKKEARVEVLVQIQREKEKRAKASEVLFTGGFYCPKTE